MHALLLVLHGGDDRMDLIYFWASILMVALPITIFAVLTYLFTKGYWKRRKAARPPLTD